MRDLRDRIETADRLRETLGYKETLARGYAVVRDGSGSLVTSKARATQAQGLEIEFADGALRLGSGARNGAKTTVKTTPKASDQGSLF